MPDFTNKYGTDAVYAPEYIIGEKNGVNNSDMVIICNDIIKCLILKLLIKQ